MLDQAEQAKIDMTIRTHWLIYMSFVTAVGMYVFVTYVVARPGNEGTQVGALRGALIAASVLAGGANFAVRRKQAGESTYAACTDLDSVIGKYTSYFFVSLALCEVPSLCGIVIVFLTMQMGEWTIFLIIAIILFGTSTPRADVIRNAVEAIRMRQSLQNT